jgi:rubrerythrin
LAASQEDLLALGQRWVVANAIIGELTAIISAYEQAAEVVKADAARRQNS